jgi:hypothetical protein
MNIPMSAKASFEAVAWPAATRAARAAFRRWHPRKREDAEAEFVAKVWDQWARLAAKGRNPEPLLRPMLHWAKHWVYRDRRLAGRASVPDIQDYRARMTRHLMDEQGCLHPCNRSARINGFLDWHPIAPDSDHVGFVAALDAAGLALADLSE